MKLPLGCMHFPHFLQLRCALSLRINAKVGKTRLTMMQAETTYYRRIDVVRHIYERWSGHGIARPLIVVGRFSK